MDSQDIEQKISVLERMLGNIQTRLSQLEEQVDAELDTRSMSMPDTQTQESLAQLRLFLVKKFPQLAQELDTIVAIPRLTGNGEIGPGNEPTPKASSGNAHIDPRRRHIS